MKCPSCGSAKVYHSRAKSLRDRFLKRALPITFYRCHDCNWRRPKLRGVKATILYALSLVFYFVVTAGILTVVAGIVILALAFLGIPIQ
jgi:transposase-like protein